MVVATLVPGFLSWLYLKMKLMKYTDFLPGDIWFRKAKSYYDNYWVELIKKGTLKSAIFNEWIDNLSWLFASWCKLWYTKNYFINFWEVMVKNGCYFLGRWTRNSAVSQEWMGKFSWFFASWWWCNVLVRLLIFICIFEFQIMGTNCSFTCSTCLYHYFHDYGII